MKNIDDRIENAIANVLGALSETVRLPKQAKPIIEEQTKLIENWRRYFTELFSENWDNKDSPSLLIFKQPYNK